MSYPFPPQQETPSRPRLRYSRNELLLMCAFGIVVFSLTGFLSFAVASHARKQGNTPPGQIASATATATSGPTVTSTPKGPHIISGPYIGGTQDAFDAAYGSPAVQYNIPTYSFTQPDGTRVYIKLYTFEAGTDGAPRAQLFSVYSSKDGVWTPDGNYQAAHVVFPPDAHFVKDIQTPDVGLLHVWQSDSLGLTFPPSAWDDSNGGPRWPAGTFAVACYTGQQMCSFATGV